MTAHSCSKLLVPRRRPETIARVRVTRLLAARAQGPLTVVCAPAGYGKTTALTQWLAGREAAWVTLDPHDNDPRRLCAHVLAALERARSGATVDAERALLHGSDPVRTVAPLVAAGMAERSAGGAGPVLVLDDYHVLDEPACHHFVAALLDTVRVVVATRRQPPLRLAWRRAAGTVAELGADELRFRSAEAERLLNGAFDLRLNPEQLAEVEQRVEGWPAGLALVASVLRSSDAPEHELAAFARSRAAVDQYLREEVLDHVRPRMREFLVRTSILDGLDASLCAAVAGDPRAGELLDEARRWNLCFNSAQRASLRYHRLFAELLRAELQACFPELVAVLHRRASLWYERAGQPEEAIRHASAAGDGERGARLLLEAWPRLIGECRHATVRELLAALPPERGELEAFCEALAVLWSHDHEQLVALEARRAHPGVGPILDRARVSPHYGRIGEAVELGWQAWERDDAPDARLRLATQLASVLWFAGDRSGVRTVLEPRLQELAGTPRMHSCALSTLALSELDDAEYELAEHYARQAVAVIEATGDGPCAAVYGALGAVLTARGELDEAERRLAHAVDLVRTQPGSVINALMLVLQAELRIAQRNRPEARRSAALARRALERYPDVGVLADRLERIESTLARRGGHIVLGSRPTAAELRVLALLASDLTNKQIAERLYLSTPTVRSHIDRLYRRLGTHNREQAVAIACERQLL